MTTAGPAAQFQIKVDGIVRAYREFRETATAAARLLQQHRPHAKIVISDLRSGSVISFDRQA